jgi:hypothetical protein
MTPERYAKPLPRATKLSRPFWEGAKRHELMLLNCTRAAISGSRRLRDVRVV